MGDVVGGVFDKEEKEAHIVGQAKCLACNHEWICSEPIGSQFFGCPQCGADKGIMKFPVQKGETHWRCNHCGNYHFLITPDRIYCPNCGSDQEGMF